MIKCWQNECSVPDFFLMDSTNVKERYQYPEIAQDILLKAYRLMLTTKRMAEVYDENKNVTSKYVHSTSRGHEAIQLATAFLLKPIDFASLYYRDEAMLLGLGLEPYELMLQLMAKRDDPFSGGRSYYGHPSLKRKGFPIIPHQSSATGMQAIPATGMAHAVHYLETLQPERLRGHMENNPVVVCSLGDGAVTEGEVSEAFQMAALKQLPIIYLVQDNEWGISATSKEMRTMTAHEFAAGFKGLDRMRVDGSDFVKAYGKIKRAFDYVRRERAPILVHGRCPLLGHHTSGVRKEWYRNEADLLLHESEDPIPKLHRNLLEAGLSEKQLLEMETVVNESVLEAFEKARAAEDPDKSTLFDFEFAPTTVIEESGNRTPENAEKVVMVDAALHAMDEILRKHPEALFYGQDVGGKLGGVFREAANLSKKYGDHRVFNTPIQEAYIIGSTVGMSAVGCKPIVEIQFADYIWPGINQLVEEISKSCYLTQGKFPVQTLIRVPIGAYGGGGPYHSGSIESTLLNIRGIKVVYPSNAADMKGLLKAAFYDPNPVVLLEHKGLYWSKLPGTETAKTFEPDEDYVIPLGKARKVAFASKQNIEQGASAVVITYGMGVYWALSAREGQEEAIEILDLRTLNPLDWEAVGESVKMHSRAMILTEEPLMNSFAESLSGRISSEFFEYLDAPVLSVGAANLPAIPLNIDLEQEMLPNPEKVRWMLKKLLSY